MPLFNPPRPIQVRLDDDGRPKRLLWRGHWDSVRVSNTWRLDTDWWLPPEAQTRRAYYKLATWQGTVLTVFHDEAKGEWFLERVMD